MRESSIDPELLNAPSPLRPVYAVSVLDQDIPRTASFIDPETADIRERDNGVS